MSLPAHGTDANSAGRGGAVGEGHRKAGAGYVGDCSPVRAPEGSGASGGKSRLQGTSGAEERAGDIGSGRVVAEEGLSDEMLAALGITREEAQQAELEFDKKRKQEEQDKKIAEVARLECACSVACVRNWACSRCDECRGTLHGQAISQLVGTDGLGGAQAWREEALEGPSGKAKRRRTSSGSTTMPGKQPGEPLV